MQFLLSTAWCVELAVAQGIQASSCNIRTVEVAQVLVQKIEHVDVAKALKLIIHSGARSILLKFLDEPTHMEK
jgi:hypothetical protein